MDSIVSFGSAIAVTFSAAMTVKNLKVSYQANHQSPTINGNGNVVTYNNFTQKNQQSFKLLRQVIVGFTFLFFPILPSLLNEVLYALSFISSIFCIGGVGYIIYTSNSNRVLDLTYIISTIFISILTYYASLNFQRFPSDYGNLYVYTIDVIKNFNLSDQYIDAVNVVLIGWLKVIGFSALFFALIYSTFAYVKQRNFDDTVRFLYAIIPVSIMGYIFSYEFVLALHYGDFGYLARMITIPYNAIMNMF